uniref:Uncharacterized protein n=1 Tax=Ditylenchus dipsaci TaxID=166011 RepID=A0A915CMY7_9BILA
MFSYLLFVVRFGFAVDLTNPPPGYALHWIVFLLGHVVCSIALHTITLYLSCATAYIRYKTIKKVGSKWNHEKAAGPIFLSVATFVVLLCIPTFLIHSVVKVGSTELAGSAGTAASNESLYTVGLAEFSTLDTCVIFKLNLWLTGIMFKVIPCILLMLFTDHKSANRAASHFLCTEFPQGILAILNGLFPNDIHQFVYLSLGEILDLLSLINCNTCFIVYPLISTQYRETLRGIVRCLARCFQANSNPYYQHYGSKKKSDMSSSTVGLGLNRVGRSSSRKYLQLQQQYVQLLPEHNYYKWAKSRQSVFNVHIPVSNGFNSPTKTANVSPTKSPKISSTILMAENSSCSTSLRFLDDRDVLL